MLSSPTCVGFRYELKQNSLSPLFLDAEPLKLLRVLPLSASHLEDNSGADLPTPDLYLLAPVQTVDWLSGTFTVPT
jgi:hypothetical protein